MTPIILNPTTTLDMTMQGLKLIEASAGTGKTFAIGNLYLRMILEGKSTEQILVVTFTNAATEELRGRIRTRIHAALSDLESNMNVCKDELLKLWHSRADAEDLKLAKHRLKVAMTSMDAAAIYTIHAFCQKMLTEHAFYSGQAFDIEMLTDDSMLWEEALKDWWRNQIAAMDAEKFTCFQRVFPSLAALNRLEKGLRQPSVKLRPDLNVDLKTIVKDLSQAMQDLASLWQQERNDIKTILLSGVLKKQKKVYKQTNIPDLCTTLDDYFVCPDVAAIPEALTALRLSELKEALKKGKDMEDIPALFFVRTDDVLTKVDTSLKELKASLLAQAHRYAHKKIARIKQQSGQLAFDDQLVHLHDAIVKSPELCDAIRERFPIAMIDEFQDTDAIQYGIFRHLYHYQEALTLLMIGDPKQAIYSFRGGDIFTYMQAKEHADNHYTLDTNWRSTPAMIAAVNHIFDRHHQPFLYDAIPFYPVQVPNKKHTLMMHQGEEVKALTLWEVPRKADDKPLNKDMGRALLHAYVANEIATLLQQAEHKELYLGKRAVQASDIAVLTRGHTESAAVRQALQQRGIAAVTAGKAHVFQSDEAKGLRIILKAIVEQGNASTLKEAMSSSLLGYHYHYIYEQLNTEKTNFQWQDTFKTLHVLWEQQGFMVMFQSLLRSLHIGEHLVAQNDGERQLTNLLQLAELLQQEAQSRVSMISLLTWFEEQCQTDDHRSDEAKLRLENDGNLVQISTIHAAKGLEYAIVFVPYLWDCKPRKLNHDLLPYYDENKQQHYLALNGSRGQLAIAEKERLAEDMRLLYVALTRASHKLYLAWGSVGTDAPKSALAYLLNPYSHKDESENHQHIDMQTLSLEPDAMIALKSQNSSNQALKIEGFSRKIANDRGISSFTKLTRSIHPQIVFIDKPDDIQDVVFQLPSNRNMGICLHALLENIDFQADIHTQTHDFLQKHGVRYGILDHQHETIKQWMDDVLHTVLQEGLCLKDLSKSQRLNELHFDMSLKKLDLHQLNQTLQQASTTALQGLMGSDCQGYLTGEIDLVFEHDGRYYIADYKSNHLGYTLDDYQPQALQASMVAHRYDVQYLIYTVALHRYLKLRIPNYDYKQHFGGVYYLFLRGMRAEHGSNYGVFAHKPEASLIDTLDHDIFGKGASQ
ncbi:MAG: exodeoxyribonuclease V subunit beta [Mariprofundaceae bacterium]|nr:exodeoxyribonuclease V subunit beta [Mariprofundaceae bacterium]